MLTTRAPQGPRVPATPFPAVARPGSAPGPCWRATSAARRRASHWRSGSAQAWTPRRWRRCSPTRRTGVADRGGPAPGRRRRRGGRRPDAARHARHAAASPPSPATPGSAGSRRSGSATAGSRSPAPPSTWSPARTRTRAASSSSPARSRSPGSRRPPARHRRRAGADAGRPDRPRRRWTRALDGSPAGARRDARPRAGSSVAAGTSGGGAPGQRPPRSSGRPRAARRAPASFDHHCAVGQPRGAGLGRHRPRPRRTLTGGVIRRATDGEPEGALLENAGGLVEHVVPPPDPGRCAARSQSSGRSCSGSASSARTTRASSPPDPDEPGLRHVRGTRRRRRAAVRVHVGVRAEGLDDAIARGFRSGAALGGAEAQRAAG